MSKEGKMLKSLITIIISGVFLLSITTAYVFAADSNVVITRPSDPIKVDGGEIVGISSADGEVTIYKGIPFAAPPVGNLRWKEPQPVVPWDGILDCKDYANYAYQAKAKTMGPYTTEFRPETDKDPSEDCLYLNVWTKKISTEKRPVIVYIHGGGNTTGYAGSFVYEGENIARKDVVYVSIAYRLGIWGFMAHPELSAESPYGVSGNYGILDQIAALKWVKNNIAKFGGDPDNITVVGQSAGALDIQALIISPMSKGLFKNAVTMSYNIITDKMQPLAEKEAETAEQFKGKTLAELRPMSSEELLNYRYSSNLVLDGKVLPNNMLDAYKTGSANDVNLITGVVSQDAVLFSFLPKSDNIPFYMPMTAVSKEDYISIVKKVFGNLADKALEVYPANSFECIDKYNQINQDATIALQNFVGKARELKSNKPTYIYKFTHLMPGPESLANGVFHTSDVPYWMNNFSPVKADYWAGIDYKIGDKMSSYLVNFAKTGNPNGPDLPKWDSYNSAEISYLEIGDPFTTVKFSKEKYEFWQEYYKTIGL